MKKKALIVDDDQSMLYILTALLEGEGFEVISVPSAGEAIEKIQRDQFDLIVTDVLMPGRVGVRSLFQYLETLPRKIPTIVISAYWDENPEMRAFYEAKTAACVSKPFDLEDFRNLVFGICGK
ncbi:MAG: response regulator [bacterium]